MLIIYVLKCPKSNAVRYVGYTGHSLEWRLAAHISEARTKRLGRRGTWIRSLLRDGFLPIIEIDCLIEDFQCWKAIEQGRIAYYRSSGSDLVNGTDGGEGLVNPTAEVRQRMSASRKALLKTPRGREIAAKGGALSAPSRKGKKRTLEQRARISLGHTGRVVSEETRQRMSVSQRKRTDARGPQSPESRQKVSVRCRGQKLTSEHKAKI